MHGIMGEEEGNKKKGQRRWPSVTVARCRRCWRGWLRSRLVALVVPYAHVLGGPRAATGGLHTTMSRNVRHACLRCSCAKAQPVLWPHAKTDEMWFIHAMAMSRVHCCRLLSLSLVSLSHRFQGGRRGLCAGKNPLWRQKRPMTGPTNCHGTRALLPRRPVRWVHSLRCQALQSCLGLGLRRRSGAYVGCDRGDERRGEQERAGESRRRV